MTEIFVKPEIVYKGEKFFKKYQKKVEIIIVNHDEFSCLELIVLGIRPGNKAKRVYLDSSLLVTKIDVDQFNSTFEIKQNASIRQKKQFNDDLEMKNIVLNMIITMLIGRLEIVPSIDMAYFDLFFQPSANDKTIINSEKGTTFTARLDFEFPNKPNGLKSYKMSNK